jgi:Arc/MetJ-type ribon-helix-helix transcriptional regulator
MKIELRPELEAMIRQDLERGQYKSVDQFVEQAVAQLHEQENWLAAQASEIRAKIEEGYAAAQRRELIDSSEVRERLEAKKQCWLCQPLHEYTQFTVQQIRR